MNCCRIRLADTVFELRTVYPGIDEYCRSYLTQEEAVLTVSVTEEDIDAERLLARKEAELEGIPYHGFTDAQYQVTAVYRKIADALSYRKSCVFHGALLEKDGAGFLFTAKSGTGKTTHIRNWLKVFPQCRVINGDKPILAQDGDHVLGYGSPWAGKEGYQENRCVPLRAIAILCRAEKNQITEIPFSEALPILISQIYRPKDDMGLARAVKTLYAWNGKVRFYRLCCNMEPESAIVAAEGMAVE